jgi:hypothetical protein
MAVTLLIIYTVLYFVGYCGALGLNLLAKRDFVPTRTAGVILVLAACAVYFFFTIQALLALEMERLSSHDQGRIVGEMLANVLLPLTVVLILVSFAARRERRRRNTEQRSAMIDPNA